MSPTELLAKQGMQRGLSTQSQSLWDLGARAQLRVGNQAYLNTLPKKTFSSSVTMPANTTAPDSRLEGLCLPLGLLGPNIWH